MVCGFPTDMTGLAHSWLRISSLALLLAQTVLAQKCYYPNGNEAPEKPCSSAQGSACCPDKWACLDNGLCYYEPDNLYGRYSCTDKSWKAEGCPSNLCTYGMQAAGAEGIPQCANHDNQWCCDGDRTHVDCCNEKPKRPFFALPDGNQYAIVGSSTANSVPNLATITGLVSDSDSSPSSTDSPSSSDSPSASKDSSPNSSATPTPTPTTFTSTSLSSGSDGVRTIIQTQISTFTPPPAASSTADPTSSNSSSSKSKLPIIVGCAVGIPLGLTFLGILIWLLRKRSQQKKNPYDPDAHSHIDGADSPEFAGGAKFKHQNGYPPAYNPDVPELAAQSVGPEHPVSNVPGKAELGGGTGFAPGTVPPAPHLVGVGGGNGTPQTGSSWGSAPPGYSPGQNQAAWAPGHQQNVSMPDAQNYMPYRTPQGGHAGDMPAMAELPVHTPPAVEMGGPSPPAVAELRTDASPPAVGENGAQRVPPH